MVCGPVEVAIAFDKSMKTCRLFDVVMSTLQRFEPTQFM